MRIAHPYEFVQGTTPLLISMPHPGLLLPEEVADLLTPEARCPTPTGTSRSSTASHRSWARAC